MVVTRRLGIMDCGSLIIRSESLIMIVSHGPWIMDRESLIIHYDAPTLVQAAPISTPGSVQNGTRPTPFQINTLGIN